MKKITASALCGLAVFGTINGSIPVFSAEINMLNDSIKGEDKKSSEEIYLEAGEGALGLGNGSKENPYKNIRTALNNIKDGQTLVLVGKVVYTQYETHVDNSALPLFINKDITIRGNSESSSLMLRAPIQLGAHVEFKDMKLEMVPEVTLGRSADGAQSKSLGQKVPRSPTIFVAGHSITLNNVDTTHGTNADQYDERPYISGGAFKGQGKLGDKSIINIVNPNKETRISAIYAGDYYNDMNMDVEINLDGKLIDTQLYTGGVNNNILEGNVTVNLSGKGNVTSFNKENHLGRLDVKLKRDYFTAEMNIDNIDNLTLEEGARATLPKGGNFNVQDVVLNRGSVIDFRYINDNPIVNGNFSGVENEDDPLKCGAIILNMNQTLNIEGAVTGLTRINSNGVESMDTFINGHQYVNAALNSTGDFSIKGAPYNRFVLNKKEEADKITWTTYNDDREIKEFRWVGGQDKIVNPETEEYYAYPIEFIDADGEMYKPSLDQLYNEFSYVLIKQDGTELEVDSDDFDIDFYYNCNSSDDVTELNQLEFAILNEENLYGEIKIIVTHLESQKQIVRTIKLTSDLDEGDKPDIEGGENPGGPDAPGGSEDKEDPEVEEPGQPGGSEDKEEPEVEGPGTPGDGEDKEEPEVEGPDVPGGSEDKEDPEVEKPGQPGGSEDKEEPEIEGPDAPGGSEDKEEPEVEEPGQPGDEEDKKEPEVEGPDVPGGSEDKEDPEAEKPGQPGGSEDKENPEVEEPESPGEDKPEIDIPENIDKSKLKKLYDKCIDSSYKKNKYTKTSFEKYERELKKSKDVLNNEKSSQKDIDKAYENLKNAVDGLKKIQSSSGGSGGSSGGGGGSSSSSKDQDSSDKSDSTSTDSNATVDVDKNLYDAVKPGSENNKTNIPGNKNHTWNLNNGNWTIKSSDGTLVKGWHKDEASGKWYMLDRNTGNMVTGWHKDINGKWYHLSSSGTMNTGWMKDTNGKWYYLNDSGAMVTGWHKDQNGKWYYLNLDGSMAVNTMVDGYKIGNDGVWIK